MTDADRRRLQHVMEAIDRVTRYTVAGRPSLDEPIVEDAVLRCLTVIGEALAALSVDTYHRLPSLPPHLPKGQRNILVHEYWRVDLDLVWATIERDLRPLGREAAALLEPDAS